MLLYALLPLPGTGPGPVVIKPIASLSLFQVIGRIFYVVDRNWNGHLSAAEIRRSNLLQTLVQLEEEADINQVSRHMHCHILFEVLQGCKNQIFFVE